VPVSYLLKLLVSPSKEITPLGNGKKNAESAKSMLDGVGTKTEKGVAVSNYRLNSGGAYEFRVTNKLPVEICNISLRILYYNASGSLMDFEDSPQSDCIPAGLTKTIVNLTGSSESRHAEAYYNYSEFPKSIATNVEIRVIGFATGK
jgi:hypothetical protein